MTIQSFGSVERYIGLHADTKPAAAPGSTFYESDTGATYTYDGTDWQGLPSGVTLLASAARTAAADSAAQTNYNGRGVLLVLEITAGGGAGYLVPVIRTTNPVTGTALDLTPSGSTFQVTAVGIYGYMFYPSGSLGSATGGYGGIKNGCALMLPRSWSVHVYAGDTTSYTYSLGAYPLL